MYEDVEGVISLMHSETLALKEAEAKGDQWAIGYHKHRLGAMADTVSALHLQEDVESFIATDLYYFETGDYPAWETEFTAPELETLKATHSFKTLDELFDIATPIREE